MKYKEALGPKYFLMPKEKKLSTFGKAVGKDAVSVDLKSRGMPSIMVWVFFDK